MQSFLSWAHRSLLGGEGPTPLPAFSTGKLLWLHCLSRVESGLSGPRAHRITGALGYDGLAGFFFHFMCVTPIQAFVELHDPFAQIAGRQGTPPLHGGAAASHPGPEAALDGGNGPLFLGGATCMDRFPSGSRFYRRDRGDDRSEDGSTSSEDPVDGAWVLEFPRLEIWGF